MSDDDRVLTTLYRAVDEVNQMLPKDSRIEKSAETALAGAEAEIESLTLVNLVVEAEIAIQMEFGLPVILSDDRALATEPSPFRTLGSLVSYVKTLIEECAHG